LAQIHSKNYKFLVMENKEKVLKTLTEVGKPLRPGEIAEQSGIDKAEVEKIIKILKKEDLIYSPVRCFYDVKK